MRHVTANLWHNRVTKSWEARSIGCLTTQKKWTGTRLSASMLPPPMSPASVASKKYARTLRCVRCVTCVGWMETGLMCAGGAVACQSNYIFTTLSMIIRDYGRPTCEMVWCTAAWCWSAASSMKRSCWANGVAAARP